MKCNPRKHWFNKIGWEMTKTIKNIHKVLKSEVGTPCLGKK
jgi:hypothetical protein